MTPVPLAPGTSRLPGIEGTPPGRGAGPGQACTLPRVAPARATDRRRRGALRRPLRTTAVVRPTAPSTPSVTGPHTNRTHARAPVPRPQPSIDSLHTAARQSAVAFFVCPSRAPTRPPQSTRLTMRWARQRRPRAKHAILLKQITKGTALSIRDVDSRRRPTRDIVFRMGQID